MKARLSTLCNLSGKVIQDLFMETRMISGKLSLLCDNTLLSVDIFLPGQKKNQQKTSLFTVQVGDTSYLQLSCVKSHITYSKTIEVGVFFVPPPYFFLFLCSLICLTTLLDLDGSCFLMFSFFFLREHPSPYTHACTHIEYIIFRESKR